MYLPEVFFSEYPLLSQSYISWGLNAAAASFRCPDIQSSLYYVWEDALALHGKSQVPK